MVTISSKPRTASHNTATATEQPYCELAAIPAISAGHFTRAAPAAEGPTIRLEYSIRDHARLTKRRARQSFHLPPTAGGRQSPAVSIPGTLEFIDPEITYQSLSPSRAKHAVFRTLAGPSKPSNKQCYLEIWDTQTHRQLRTHNLSAVHQAFVLNDTFGYPSWDASETHLAYVAESTAEADPSSSSWLERNRYVPDFGEQLTGIRLPAIFVASIDDDPAGPKSTPVPAPLIQLTDPATDPARLAWGQPAFGRSSGTESVELFCTGFASLSDHRRLGLIYCQNRLSAIYQLSFEIPLVEKPAGHHPLERRHPVNFICKRISAHDRSARSPRVIADLVVYLANPIGGPHASCASLNVYDPQTKNARVLVGQVDEPTAENPFPGLYIDALPSQPTLYDSIDPQKAMIVTSSIWGSLKKLLTIDLRGGEIKAHPPPCDGSCAVLSTDGHTQVLSVVSQTNSSPQVWMATLGEGCTFSWQKVTHLKASHDVQSQLSQLQCQIIKLPPNDLGPTDIVLTSPTLDMVRELGLAKKTSLVIVPHGGPHSTALNEFSPSTAAMALMGHSIAYVNYPGSLGFGQKWVEDLPRRLGIADVDSCKLAVDHLCSSGPIQALEIGKRVFVSGGSHGGFITAHLTSRYPGLFAAACMRNPVVDLVGTASGGSDIPDWSYAEADIAFPLLASGSEGRDGEVGKVSVNEPDFKVLRDRSPIKFIRNVTTPTLVLLGTQDRWYHGLKSLQTEAELVLFEDNSHPLDSIGAELNSFMVWVEFLSGR